MDPYKALLEKAKKELPEESASSARFEIPKVRGHIQGNRTVISNFQQIANVLGRDPEHLFKYVLKELASPGEIKKTGVIIGRKVSASLVNEKISMYTKEFVLCQECGKPDTKIVKEGQVNYLNCLACGARRPLRGRSK